MRLINADARVTIQSFDQEYDHTEMSVEQALDFATDEGCPQVVDAITVEWLKQQFYDNPNSQWAEKCRDVFTGWQKWQRLQKEQEAKNEHERMDDM